MPQSTLEVGAIFGKVLYSGGMLSDAAAVLAECRDLGERLGEFCPARPVSMVVAQLVEHSTGSWQRAAHDLLAAAGDEDDPHSRQHAYLERATILARLDPRRSEADVRTSVGFARADSVDAGCQRCFTEVLIRSAEALARIGDVEVGRQLFASQAANVLPEDTAMSLWARQTEAAIAVAMGDLETAVAVRRTLTAEAKSMGFRMESLWLQLDLGATLSSVDRTSAADVLRAAGTTAEAMGVRTWRRGPGGQAGSNRPALTERELQVARLAARGASNPEIAAALFLSRKTVERHVSNSLAKLGLRNRVELAAALDSFDG
jgi:DNA-binding CsgD family transcriptional regulator